MVVEAAPAPGEPMDINTAVRLVMKKALAHDGLARGLHEAARCIERVRRRQGYAFMREGAFTSPVSRVTGATAGCCIARAGTTGSAAADAGHLVQKMSCLRPQPQGCRHSIALVESVQVPQGYQC